MSDTKYLARCADCGHAYKVPSATKVYPCKECGGDVCAMVAEPAEEEELVEEEESEPTLPEERSIRARHTAKPKSKVPMILGAAALVLAAVGGVGYGLGWFGFLTGAQPDFDKVTASFVKDWNATNMEALKAYSHPAKLDEFSTKFDAIQTQRGWTSFPTIDQEVHEVMESTADKGKTAKIGLSYSEGDDTAEWATIHWQFFDQQRRWHIYDFDVVPMRLMPVAEKFQTAWSDGDFESLRPFFKPGTEEKMVELYTKQANKNNWMDSFPVLGKITIENEEGMRSPANFLAEKVYVSFHTPDGPLSGPWAYNKDKNVWYNNGLKEIPSR